MQTPNVSLCLNSPLLRTLLLVCTLHFAITVAPYGPSPTFFCSSEKIENHDENYNLKN